MTGLIDVARHISAKARAARVGRLLQLIEAISARTGRCRIIDLGGQIGYWRALGAERLDALGVHILAVTLEAEPEQPANDVERRIFQALQGDACQLGH